MERYGRLESEIEFVAVGHLAIDLCEGRQTLGGAAAYSSLTASRLGLAVAVVTAVGEDFDLFDSLQGMEIGFHRHGVSTSFENTYEKGDRRQRLLGRARPLAGDGLHFFRSRLAADAMVLYCPIAQEIQPPFHRLAPRGLCGVTPQGLFRRWDADGLVHVASCDGPLLAGADLVSLSVTDPPAPDDFARSLDGRVAVLAMTEGSRGARVFTGGKCYRVPAFPMPEKDPTGAGDIFAASFLVALRNGLPPLEAAQFACCGASFAVERPGVEGVPPDRTSVEARLDEYRKRFQPEELDP